MTKKKLMGFAVMPRELHLKIARKGGHSVPPEKRSFSTNPGLASRAGKIGGKNPMTPRAFTNNRVLAKRAGELGAIARLAKKRTPQHE